MWIKNITQRMSNKSSYDWTTLGCCSLAFILYINTLYSGFVYDDRRAILTNRDVAAQSTWRQIFYNDFWGTPLTDTGSHGSYRPLSVLSFRLNYLLGGFTPIGYHLINNLLHCLATGLVVKLARQFLNSTWAVLVTGALFAVHPIHTEAVAGIVGRADLAACIFYLLTYFTYMRHIIWREQSDQRQWLTLALTLVLSVMAVLFKETAITVLVICGLYDIIRGLLGYTDKHRKRSLCILIMALLATIYCRLWVLPRPQTSFSTADNPIAKSSAFWTRLLTFLYLPVFNFKLLVSPQMLSFDWGMDAIPRITTIFDQRNLLSLVFYGTLVTVSWKSCRKLLLRRQYNRRRQVQASSNASSSTSYVQYLIQQQAHRKSRTKKKTIAYANNLSTPTVAATNQQLSYATTTATNITSNNQQYACICQDCKHELSSGHHTPTCQSLNNNNNVVSFGKGIFSDCCCHQLMSSSRTPTVLSLALHKALNTVTRSSRSSSSCSNSTTSSNQSSGSSISRCSSAPSTGRESDAGGDITLAYLPNSKRNECVLLMAFAFLTLPFLPATNLFFYVGFVVAERLLYLPSVGYCLIVGFGIEKIVIRLSSSQTAHKRFVIFWLCLSLLLAAMSARTIRRNSDWTNEETLYRSAVQVNPPKALGNLGSVLSSQARYAEAKEVLLDAIKYRPNMADAHFNLGILYQNQQNFKAAIECFQRAIHFRPNLAVAYLNLGTSLIALGKCQEAVHILQEGTKIDGTGVRDREAHENARISSYLQLGALYAQQSKLQRALAVYREALHLRPTTYYQRDIIYQRIGDIFGRLQNWVEAERHHRAALELQPDQVAAHVSYGITLARNSSRASEAEWWFKRALQLAPQQASVYHHYADFLERQARPNEALHYHLRAAELMPNDYSLVVAAATALRILERHEEAEIWYRKAVFLRPNDAYAHTNLGAILHLLGSTKNAATSYKEALRLQPGDPTTLKNLAKLGIREIQ